MHVSHAQRFRTEIQTAAGRILAVMVLIAAACALASAQGSVPNPKHFFWAPGQPNTPNPSSLASDLIYHGGSAGSGAIGVEVNPAVYLVFWGPDWANGFTTTDANGQSFTSQSLQNYVTSFLTNLGGTSWAAIQTEYCRGIPAGSTSCDQPGAVYVTNPRKQLKGVWTDSTAVPSDIIASGLAENVVDDPIAMEAMRASAHFNYDPQATYIILTPPTTIATGQPVYCGYHTQTTSVDGVGNPYRLQYAFIPFLNASWPGLGSGGCGMNSVNVVSDSFGHGVFDGYSIVVGHEYAEAITDPDNFTSVQDGWNDVQTSETGDKCAWIHLANVSMNNHTKFAVQPLWSNRAFDAGGEGCVRSAPTNPHAMPSVGITPPAQDVCMNPANVCPPGVAAGQFMPVNMAYFGGLVEVNPKIYLVFWGWGQAGAFDHTSLSNPAWDPDGVGALMTRFIAAIGGTSWDNIVTQYYQNDYNGNYSQAGNPAHQLAGVWHDNTNPIHDNLSPIELAREAARAVQHFGIRDLANSQIVVAQPQKYNDAGFNALNYCAWHDFTTPISYPGVTPGMAFVNMPYILNAGGSCGKDFVNPAPAGDVDGVTIVLGHEIAETQTDPGAESSAGQVAYGGWFDYQGWEIGDKCAWVGDGLQVPGAAFNMIGNDGRGYPVQTLWSNKSLQGVGFCSQGF
jgi:hypothetical protein